jgi:hypothetical protein
MMKKSSSILKRHFISRVLIRNGRPVVYFSGGVLLQLSLLTRHLPSLFIISMVP